MMEAMRKILVLMLAGSICGLGAAAADNAALRNWFGDPFFQVSKDLPHCPVPLGPLLTEAEMKGESHSRVERGTSCWLAGECKQPNAYLYDAAIADAIRQRLADDPDFKGASLWITVKRRFVWAEGCIVNPEQARAIETLLKSVPDVERVIVNLMPGVSGKPPYRVLPAPRF